MGINIMRFIALILLVCSFISSANSLLSPTFEVNLASVSDSNILRNSMEKSDTILQLSPIIGALAERGKYQLQLNYEGLYQKYKDASELDFTDHFANLSMRVTHTERLTTEFKIEYLDEVEEPGITNASTETLEQFTEKNVKTGNLRIAYGRADSLGQLVLKIGHRQEVYTNNQQQWRDHHANQVTGQFYYRIAPKIRVLFEATNVHFDYQNPNGFADLSSEDQRYLVGATWQATSKTSGAFKIGYQDKAYNDEVFNSISGISYQLDMDWRPSTHSKISMTASRLTSESAQLGIGGFVSNNLSGQIEHALTERLKFKLILSQSDYDITYDIKRKDTRTHNALELDYSLSYWASLQMSYSTIQRDSNNDNFKFDGELMKLGFMTQFN